MPSTSTLAAQHASSWVLFIGVLLPAASSALAHSRTAGVETLEGLGTTCAIDTPALAGPAAVMYWSAPTNDRLEVGIMRPMLTSSFCTCAAAPDSSVLTMKSGFCANIACTSDLPSWTLRLTPSDCGSRLIFFR